MSDDESESGYGLVMPFVVCQTQGGPYEDGAFVAGAWFGRLDSLLEEGSREVIVDIAVPSPLVPQLDLLAMKHGYTLTATPWDEAPDEHTFVTFTRPEREPVTREDVAKAIESDYLGDSTDAVWALIHPDETP